MLKKEKVKGTALLMLTEQKLVSEYKIARGPASVLAAAIEKLNGPMKKAEKAEARFSQEVLFERFFLDADTLMSWCLCA